MKYLIILILIISSCKDEIICDTSFRQYNLQTIDTLEWVLITDYDYGDTLYYSKNVYGVVPLIDDSYFQKVGPNSQIGLTIGYRFLNDSVGGRFLGVCAYTDECHVIYSQSFDTLK